MDRKSITSRLLAFAAAGGMLIPGGAWGQERASQPADAAASPAAAADETSPGVESSGTPSSEADRSGEASRKARTPRKAIRDVSLDEQERLSGRILSPAGDALDGALVELKQGQDVRATTTTDADGRFAFEGVEGGVYTVSTANGATVCRVWSHDAAPEKSAGSVVLRTMDPTAALQEDPVIRGQLGYLDPANTVSLLLGVAAVTLSAVVLAEVDDLQGDVKDVKQQLASP